MEWVETTGKTIEEAKAGALDQLGVSEDDAEFEVLEEPRAGLFGRMRGEARVRARVRPTQPRPKLDRRDRRRKSDAGETATTEEQPAGQGGRGRSGRGGRSTRTAVLEDGTPPGVEESAASDVGLDGAGESVDGANGAPSSADRSGAPRSGRNRRRGSNGASNGARNGRGTQEHERRDAAQEQGDEEPMVDAQQVGDEAQKFVQLLVDAFGLPGTASLRRDGDDLEVAVEGTDLGLLVGPRGVTLQAIQELTRVAAQRRLGDHDTRLRVDVGGYRVRRREALARFAQEQAAAVISEGRARILEPMSSADRKVIHDTLVEVEGVVTRSEGDDPNRRVVIAPAGD